MTKEECCRIFGIEDIMDLPQVAMDVIMGDKARRDAIYAELLDVNRHDMSYDWFRQLYEEEFAQRKKQKQDFTPWEVSELVAKIAVPTIGTIHEPTAGTGGLIISAWWEQCRRVAPWEHFPSRHMITVWELSDRSVPLLLLNLSIRGVLSVRRTVERIYVLNGEKNFTKIVLSEPKTTNARRDVPICKELMSMVKPLKKVVNENFYVLTNAEKPTEPRTYRNFFYRLMEKLGMPHIRYHDLRHTFATRCIESKCDYKTVSVLLGHADIATTLNMYVHPDETQKRNVVNKVFRTLSR